MIGAERLMLIGCLLHGAMGRDWAIWMPQNIEALSGSCVLIPCTFDNPSKHDEALARDPSSLMGMWLRNGEKVFHTHSRLSPLQGRITGDLLQKNCTTVMENIPINYAGPYYFGIEGPLVFIFEDHHAQINIRDSPPKPKLTPEVVEVQEGTSVKLRCSAAAPCPDLPPNLSWTPRLGDSVDQLQENEDGTKSASSVQTFTASHLHHGQNITCRANYTLQQGETLRKSTLTLRVQYVPQISDSGSCSRSAEEISCSCESRGNPSPSLEWHVSGLRVTNSTDRVIREEQLGNTGLRSSLTVRQSQGDTPTVICVSANTVGSSSLQLPFPQQHSGLHTNLLLLIIIGGLSCLNVLTVLTVGFCLHKNKRLSRRLKEGRDDGTYTNLQLDNVSPDYDVLQGSRVDTERCPPGGAPELQLANISHVYEVLEESRVDTERCPPGGAPALK